MDGETKTLLLEVNAALADLVESFSTAEISNTLAEMLEVMKARKQPEAMPAPVTHVNVTNDVHPAPVTVSVVQSGGFKHTFEWDGNRIVGATSTPIKPKAQT